MQPLQSSPSKLLPIKKTSKALRSLSPLQQRRRKVKKTQTLPARWRNGGLKRSASMNNMYLPRPETQISTSSYRSSSGTHLPRMRKHKTDKKTKPLGIIAGSKPPAGSKALPRPKIQLEPTSRRSMSPIHIRFDLKSPHTRRNSEPAMTPKSPMTSVHFTPKPYKLNLERPNSPNPKRRTPKKIEKQITNPNIPVVHEEQISYAKFIVSLMGVVEKPDTAEKLLEDITKGEYRSRIDSHEFAAVLKTAFSNFSLGVSMYKWHSKIPEEMKTILIETLKQDQLSASLDGLISFLELLIDIVNIETSANKKNTVPSSLNNELDSVYNV